MFTNIANSLLLIGVTVGYLCSAASQCQDSNFYDENVVVDTSFKSLKGTWLSEGCETRPGPEYVLRHYTFDNVGKYKLIQHHYWDHSCSTPKLTITSTGYLKTRRDLLFNQDAFSGYTKPTNITVIPQDLKAAQELETLISENCPNQYWKSWRRYEEHLVYFNPVKHKMQPHDHNRHAHYTQQHIRNGSNIIACLGNLKWAFNEIKLLKVQLRLKKPTLDKSKEMHWELLLGDIPSRISLLPQYIPTSFQTVLVKLSNGETVSVKGKTYYVKYSCNICSKLISNEKMPPHLIEKLKLPSYIWGKWASEKCETRPLGLYLKRKFTFFNDGLIWIGEHKFYSDPFCRNQKFVITASGNLTLGKANKLLQEATNIDLEIKRATLIIFDQSMAYSIPYGTCGEEMWKIGVPQELKLTNGCLQLGVQIPSTHYDIIKIEMSYQGSWLLFMGQADTENVPLGPNDRPTAFQMPLVKCGSPNFENDLVSMSMSKAGDITSSFVTNILIYSLYIISINL